MSGEVKGEVEEKKGGVEVVERKEFFFFKEDKGRGCGEMRGEKNAQGFGKKRERTAEGEKMGKN